MKKILIIYAFAGLLATDLCSAQQKIATYCSIIAVPLKVNLAKRNGEFRVRFIIENPQVQYRDTTIWHNLKKIKSYHIISGALNYMSSIGWTFVSAVPLADYSGGTAGFYFIFKRSLNESGINIPVK